MRSSRYDLIKVERKLLQAAATGHLARVLRVLEKNGKYLVKKRRKQGRRSERERRDKRKRHREFIDSDLDLASGSLSDEEPSTSGHFSYEYESEEEIDGKVRKGKKHSYSSRKSRQSDVLKEALVRIDINCADAEGLTPLHHACYAGSTELVEFLLAEGADKTAQDAKGNSPLHIAARYGFRDIIAILRDAGGDMHASNYEGVTPLIAVEARIERLRKEKEKSLKPRKKYMEPQDWGTRLADELSDDESWWGHSWGEPQPKKDWHREDWSEFLYKEEDDDDLFPGTSRKRKSKDPLEGGLFKELSDHRKREQEERNREAKRILEEEIAKDRAWRERVLQKKSVDRNKRLSINSTATVEKSYSSLCNKRNAANKASGRFKLAASWVICRTSSKRRCDRSRSWASSSLAYSMWKDGNTFRFNTRPAWCPAPTATARASPPAAPPWRNPPRPRPGRSRKRTCSDSRGPAAAGRRLFSCPQFAGLAHLVTTRSNAGCVALPPKTSRKMRQM